MKAVQALLFLAALLVTITSNAAAASLEAGGYLFSDEQGGFRLISAMGTGSRDDPVVLVEEFTSSGPVTLTIRRLPHIFDPKKPIPPDPTVNIAIIKKVINRSGRVWVGFDLELQELFQVPSLHGDGLSFDQIGKLPGDIQSDIFPLSDRFFEPHDRIHFFNGSVNPDGAAKFSLYITDPTPVNVFYLLQQPQLLYARNRSPEIKFAQKSFRLFSPNSLLLPRSGPQ